MSEAVELASPSRDVASSTELTCRICGGRALGEVLNLGMMPLVNNLLTSVDEAAARYPLKVVFCRDCSLAQLTECPPPAEMFDAYCYFSSQSQTMVEHAGVLVQRFVTAGDRVVEIASNDGYLLSQAAEAGATVLGIDPARNIAAYANEIGVPTRCEYFDRDAAERVRDEWGRADVMFANNVLAHVPDPHEIAAGIAALLTADGVAHIEVPYVGNMIDACAFDTIYHEHRCYFSVCSLRRLFSAHDLRLVDIDVIPIHGGSLHVQVSREGAEAKADTFCEAERDRGLFDDSGYSGFADRVQQIRDELIDAMDRFDTIGAYGAAAKGIVLLNFFGLGVDRIPWVADVSPHKQGRFVPGTRQAIVSPDRLLTDRPQACVLLPWNIADEIMRRNAAYRELGGRFIVPVPKVSIC